MKKLILLAMVLGLLSGCHRSQLTWVRDDIGNHTEFNRRFNSDKYQCMKEANALVPPSFSWASGEVGFVIAAQDQARRRQNAAFFAAFSACMEASGWHKEYWKWNSDTKQYERPNQNSQRRVM